MLLRLALSAILFYVLWRVAWSVLKGVFLGMGYQPPGKSGAQSVGLVRDPICGTFIMPSKALTSGSGSSTRYFCSEKCRTDYAGRW
jgi:YHS domain-containing protein